MRKPGKIGFTHFLLPLIFVVIIHLFSGKVKIFFESNLHSGGARLLFGRLIDAGNLMREAPERKREGECLARLADSVSASYPCNY